MKRQSVLAHSTRTRHHGTTVWLTTIVILVGGYLMSQSARSAQNDSLSVTFHGTLKRKPCHISNDGDIYVHFGNVGINKVDGERYKQLVPYTVKCEETDPSWTLKLMVKGTPSGFEETALKTNANGLGIRILRDGQPLKINDAITINNSSLPILQAVPVQKSGVTLVEQDFMATATLLAEYE